MAGKRNIVIDFIVDDKDAARSLGNIDRNVKKTSDGFGKASVAIVAAFGVQAAGAVVRFADQMGELAIANEAARTRSSVVFGDMGKDAELWADRVNESMGMGKDATLGLLAATGDLLVPMGLARDTALEYSQKILETGDALSVWTGGTVTAKDAVEKITKALLGERDGLVELGIKLSDAEVKARLLETGQSDLTGQALQLATAQVSLDAIMEKSADALTSAADGTNDLVAARKAMIAQKEDAKAALADVSAGPIAAGYKLAGDMVGTFVTSAGQLAHALDPPRKASADLAAVVENMRQEIGAFSEDARQNFLTALADMAARGSDVNLVLDEAATMFGLSGEEASSAADFIREHADMMHMSQEEANEMADAIDESAKKVHEQGRQAAAAQRDVEGLAGATEVLTESNADLTTQLGLATEAQKRLTEEQKQLDPLYKLIDAAQKHEAALQKVIELQAAGETASDEYGDALLDVTKSQADLSAAQLEFAQGSGKSAIAALEEMGRRAGLTDDQIRFLIQSFYDLGAAIGSVPSGSITTSSGNKVPIGTGPGQAFDHGGVVAGPLGSPQVVLAHAGETILPTHKTGFGGAGSTININMQGTGDAALDALRAGAMYAVLRRMET
jgi:hypothetical protein